MIWWIHRREVSSRVFRGCFLFHLLLRVYSLLRWLLPQDKLFFSVCFVGFGSTAFGQELILNLEKLSHRSINDILVGFSCSWKGSYIFLPMIFSSFFFFGVDLLTSILKFRCKNILYSFHLAIFLAISDLLIKAILTNTCIACTLWMV